MNFILNTLLLKYLLAGLLLIILSYLIFRKIVRRDYLAKGKLTITSCMLELVIFALHANFMYLFIPVPWPDLPRFPSDPIMNLLAKVLVFGGLILVFVAMTNLGYGPTMGQDKNRLRTVGLYQLSRNPQVIAYGAILAGLILCYPSMYAVGWFTIYMIMIGFMIKTEEEFLMKKYGQSYIAYCRKVPRFIRLIH